MVYGWFACLRLTNVYHLWANLQFSPLNIKAQFEDKKKNQFGDLYLVIYWGALSRFVFVKFNKVSASFDKLPL